MNLSNAQSGPDAPIRGFGEDGDAYLQTHPGGHTTIWTKTSGVWAATGNVSTGGSSGSSSDVVQVATETLNNAQILALPTTPITIVPNPGAGKQIQWITAAVYLDFSAGAIGAGADAFWQLCFVGGEFPIENSGLMRVPLTATIRVGNFIQVGSFSEPDNNLVTVTNEQDYSNKALAIGDIYNGVDDYTLGNAANTFKVIVYYTVVDLS